MLNISSKWPIWFILLVSSVFVNGVNAKFQQTNYLAQVVPDTEPTTDLEKYKSHYKAAMLASDDGELIIELPPTISIQESTPVRWSLHYCFVGEFV